MKRVPFKLTGNARFVLYMKYYPERLKTVEIDIDEDGGEPPIHLRIPIQSEEWRLSIILAWITIASL